MKILHINQTDISGGAAIAAYRLHQGLISQGINSKLLVDNIKTSSEHVELINRRRNRENVTSRWAWRLGLNYVSITSTFNIPKHKFYQEADVLNFHNLHGDYFNYLALPFLTKKKAAIFTLHDIWSFTGHCAFNYGYKCEKWKIGCGQCPHLDICPSTGKDSTQIEWKLKNWVYHRSDLTIVTPSKWLKEQAKQSMLHHLSINHIPHGLDIEAYKPLDMKQCRSILGIPAKKKVLMFGAAKITDTHKGGDLLQKALFCLPSSLKSEIVVLILGEGAEVIINSIDIQTINLGYVSSDRLKSITYSAADLFIFPTRADIFGLVLQESMACGTPMVSFNVGGVPDLVRHNTTGYLAQPEDYQDFSQGIVKLLEDDQLRETLSKNCREIAVKEYAIELQATRYIELYNQILEK